MPTPRRGCRVGAVIAQIRRAGYRSVDGDLGGGRGRRRVAGDHHDQGLERVQLLYQRDLNRGSKAIPELEPRVLATGHGRPMASAATATALRARFPGMRQLS
jgi:hypothetical protein